EAHPECQLPRLERDDAGTWLDPLTQDFFRFSGRDLLDVHTACGAADDHRAGRCTIDDDAQVEFAIDLHSLFDQYPADFAPVGPGLMRDERHPKHLLGELLGFLNGLRERDASAP